MAVDEAHWAPYQPYIEHARAHWGRTTPFRLGLAVAEDGKYLPNPYSTPRAQQSYAEGIKTGARWRRDKQLKELKEGATNG